MEIPKNPYCYDGWQEKLLRSYSIEKLKRILFEFDVWSNEWEENIDERELLNQEDKDEIIKWILESEDSFLFIHRMIETGILNDVTIDSNNNLIISSRRDQNLFILNRPRRSLEAASLHNAQWALFEHDKWFCSFDDLNIRKLRIKINPSIKEEIIEWICDTDPIFEEGGLLSFISEMFERGILFDPVYINQEGKLMRIDIP